MLTASNKPAPSTYHRNAGRPLLQREQRLQRNGADNAGANLVSGSDDLGRTMPAGASLTAPTP
jgi:hypothetical protein